MTFPLNSLRLVAPLLLLSLLSGCSFTQPVVEVTARTVFTPLPLSLAKIEARRKCREHADEMHAQETDLERTAALNREVEDYQALVEEALIYRAETVSLVEKLRATLDRGETIPGQDLSALNEGLSSHLELREKLFQMAEVHECWLNDNGTPTGMSGAQRLKGIMVSLSAALVLYDNYLLAISLYQEEPRLRMLLNNKDVGYGIDYGEVNRVALSFASEENRNRVRHGIAYYENAMDGLQGVPMQDKHLLFLDQLINQSPSYSMTKRFSPLAYLGRKMEFYMPFTVEALLRLKNEGVGMASMIFGNSVGLVESRRGKLYGHSEVTKSLSNGLQAGDILIERTPFRLTNSFIPGYWGHSAVWVGTETELRELGIWDHPVIQAYQNEISQGRSVIEALRSGVELNSLEHFLNVDDLAVLRHSSLESGERARTILQAFRQAGKRYDFNFDVETRDRLGCAELVYHAFGSVDWPTRNRLGRSTMTPDDVAVRAIGDGPLDVVQLYADGKRVEDASRLAFSKLMAGGTAGE